jgi:RNA polymerase sigma factor (sigma-70 family)
MPNTDPSLLAARLRRMAAAAGGLPDAELVRRYATARDAAAFEVLVWRHGPMVWAACRRALGHPQDAEDAFQAAFLALARRAGALGRGEAVGGWLHRVAVRAALRVRARRRPAAALPEDVPAAPDDPAGRELAGAVDEELDRLPAPYRAAFVLCCLQGLTNAEAARELGCPVGTVDSRLHAARTRLRARLAGRGFGPASLAALVAGPAPAAVSAAAAGLALDPSAARPEVARLATSLTGGTMRGPLLIAATVALGAAGAWALGKRPAPPPARPAAAVPVSVADHGPWLLFTQMVLKPGENSSRTLRLVRQRFRDGRPADREELYTGDASEFGYQGRYRVVGGRYVVFESATVFDLAAKEAAHTFGGGRVLAVEGGKVYFYANKEVGEQGVFCYDLGARKRERVAGLGEGRWGLRGAVSPAGTKSITREFAAGAVLAGAETAYDLVLNRPGKPPENLGRFASTVGMTGAGFGPDAPPGAWLDDDRFMTQTTLGTVVAVDTATGKAEKVVDIPPTHQPGEKAWETIGAMGFTPLGLQQPRFTPLPDGRMLYEADVMYFIDVAKKTWERAKWRPLGNGFDFAADPKIEDVDRYSKRVTVPLRHDGKEIGTSESVWWTTAEKPRAVATDGHLAVVERVRRPGATVPTDAVRVWTAAAGGWVVLDGWADSVIGWVR